MTNCFKECTRIKNNKKFPMNYQMIVKSYPILQTKITMSTFKIKLLIFETRVNQNNSRNFKQFILYQ